MMHYRVVDIIVIVIAILVAIAWIVVMIGIWLMFDIAANIAKIADNIALLVLQE